MGTLSIIRTGARHHQGCGWCFFNCSFQFRGRGRGFCVPLVKTYHVVSGGAAALPLFRFPTCYLEKDQLGFQCHQEKPGSELKDKIMQKQVPLRFLLSDSLVKEEVVFWFLYFYDNLIFETCRCHIEGFLCLARWRFMGGLKRFGWYSLFATLRLILLHKKCKR